jgi:RNA recognition motif-containing protein
MRSLSGISSVSRVKVSGKADAFPSRVSALRLKREFLEAVAGRNREFTKQNTTLMNSGHALANSRAGLN